MKQMLYFESRGFEGIILHLIIVYMSATRPTRREADEPRAYTYCSPAD
jgi:hypothetical protein